MSSFLVITWLSLSVSAQTTTKEPTNDPTVRPVEVQGTDPYGASVGSDEFFGVNVFLIDGVIAAGFATFGAIAYVDALFIRINDYFYIGAIIAALIGFLDVFSDVVFAVTVMTKPSAPFEMIIGAWLFIVLPVAVSIVQLAYMAHTEWSRCVRLKRWILKNSYILYILPVFMGSSFVSLSILNSNALKLKVFSMGLSKDELARFNVQRVWSIVFLEVKSTHFEAVSCS